MYVLRCTTIGLKQEGGRKTLRHADMNLRFKPHFTAKISKFWPASQKIRLCVDVIWRHLCSNVVLPIYKYIYIHIERAIPIYIESSASYVWRSLPLYIQFYRMGDNRGTVNASTVCIFLTSWRQKTRVKYCNVDSSLWYEIWFAMMCICMNVIFYISTKIQQF